MKEIGPNLYLEQNVFSVQTILKIQENFEFYSTIELSLTYCKNKLSLQILFVEFWSLPW